MSYPVTPCQCITCHTSRKLYRHLGLIAVALIAVVLAVLGTVAMVDSNRVSTLPACIEEDGSGQNYTCVWTDPDTGNLYINN